MALNKDMNLSQIKNFLEKEVKEQIFLEIEPILYIGREAGGYFGATRQILCYMDFLGALYHGYSDKEKEEDLKKPRKILLPSKIRYVVEFITGFIADQIGDTKYKENGPVFYQMYRHGLVHTYQPKLIKQKNGRLLEWAIYKGQRDSHKETMGSDEGKVTIPNARHLDIVVDPRNKENDLLTISVTCLYKDLLTVIDKFYSVIEEKGNQESNALLRNWRTTTTAILEPEEHTVIGGDT